MALTDLQVNNNYSFDPFEAYALVAPGEYKINPGLIFASRREAEVYNEKSGLGENGYSIVSVFIQNSGSFF